MKVENTHFKTVWLENNQVKMIDQTLLPFEFKIINCINYRETAEAIRNMKVRGAGAIGCTAGFAMAQACIEFQQDAEKLLQAKKFIEDTRPTAQNLFYATNLVFEASKISVKNAVNKAIEICKKDEESSLKIGEYGAELIHNGMGIETHCNAGWLAFTDYGTALSPIYMAHRQGKKIKVYVDETRPRSQGAKLTAWELSNENVEHVIIPDNAGAFFMAKGDINMMIVGADRIAANGDVANKIGTLEKAIAAKYYNIPFYVAAPIATFDINCPKGENIPIEFRSENEVLWNSGKTKHNEIIDILYASPQSHALNPAFDVTPANLITGIITEKGIIKPNSEQILKITQNA